MGGAGERTGIVPAIRALELERQRLKERCLDLLLRHGIEDSTTNVEILQGAVLEAFEEYQTAQATGWLNDAEAASEIQQRWQQAMKSIKSAAPTLVEAIRNIEGELQHPLIADPRGCDSELVEELLAPYTRLAKMANQKGRRGPKGKPYIKWMAKPLARAWSELTGKPVKFGTHGGTPSPPLAFVFDCMQLVDREFSIETLRKLDLSGQ